MGVITVNSRVACGHVGNAAAGPALLALGVEAWPIDTVVLSSHPGHGRVRGGPRPPEEVAALLDGLVERGVLGRARAALSGYLGRPENADAVLATVKALRAANPTALYACDPVAGDAREGFYVPDDVRQAIRDHLAPAADLLLPNVFELAWLADQPLAALRTPRDVAAAARRLAERRRGQRVLVTSVPDGDGRLGALLVAGDAAWLAAMPRIETGIKGAGDLLAALFVGRRVLGVPEPEALALAVGGTARVLRRAAKSGGDELMLHRALAVLQRAPPAPLAKVG